MISVNTTPAHITMFRKFNVWYSVADGNFNDPAVWVGNGRKKRGIPGAGDDVIINHTVTLNMGISLRNVTVNGTMKGAPEISVYIFGDLKAPGIIDFTSALITLGLRGTNNEVHDFTAGSSTIVYMGAVDQPILNLTYNHLVVDSGLYDTGAIAVGVRYTKYLTADTVVAGDFTVIGCLFEIGGHSFTVMGRTSAGGGWGGIPVIQKSVFGGTVLFVGLIHGSSTALLWNFTANDDVEFRGGFDGSNFSAFNMGTATYRFTTNNQILGTNVFSVTGLFEIADGIVLTLTGTLQLIGSGNVNGVSSASRLDVKGVFSYTSAGQVGKPMTTGEFNYNAGAGSVIGYNFNGDFTLPYGVYSGLSLTGTGTKTLGQDTAITSLSSSGSGVFELSSYNFINTGTTFNGSAHTISKNSATGVTVWGGLYSTQFLNQNLFGEATIEFRGGLVMSGVVMSTGTLLFSATQTVVFNPSNSALFTINNLLVSEDVVLTIAGNDSITVTGTINGNDASSTLDNRQQIIYKNPQKPMMIGVLQCNAAINTFIYGSAGDQDIAGGIYRNLTINGGGIKKLQGNVSVLNSYTLTAPAVVDDNGFSLTNP